MFVPMMCGKDYLIIMTSRHYYLEQMFNTFNKWCLEYVLRSILKIQFLIPFKNDSKMTLVAIKINVGHEVVNFKYASTPMYFKHVLKFLLPIQQHNCFVAYVTKNKKPLLG